MRYDIVFTTVFEYDGPVAESQNELRAAPASDGRQQLLHYDVRTRPSSRVWSYSDYWGTRVDTFGVRAAHDRLEVTAEATVETSVPARVTASPRRYELEDPAFRDLHLDYLSRSPHVSWTDDIAGPARERVEEAGDDVVGAVLSLHRYIGTGFEYDQDGDTYVGVPIEEVLASRRGVCQDFAHLMVGMCRSVGIPARYVSGYLFARDGQAGDDPGDDRIEVQTHAWVEVAIPGHGWWGLDPTNRQEIGVRHIKIGHGRDYDDVTPLRGVYSGSAEHTLGVHVELRRMVAAQQQQQ